jgi:ribosomal protein S18 acetylase RimI-like enzyme
VNPPVAIRLATSADVPAIAAMSRDQVERGLPWSWTAGRVRYALRDRNVNVVVAGDGDRLLGFGIMLYADEDAHLLLFAVDPSCRRRGVGAAILNWLEVVARDAGLKRVLLECRRENEVARNFYGALGYHERTIVRRMYSGVEDGVTLEKWLAQFAPLDDHTANS